MTITSETANLDQSQCRKINSHLEIYTNSYYHIKQLSLLTSPTIISDTEVIFPQPLYVWGTHTVKKFLTVDT